MPHKRGVAVATPAKKTPPSVFEKAAKKAGLDSQPGKSAIEGRYRAQIDTMKNGARFAGSVDLDSFFAKAEGTSHRWDFGIGIEGEGMSPYAAWVEPHSAGGTGEVTTMLAKLNWLKAKLNLPAFADLKALTSACSQHGGRPYHWLATAHVAIRSGSREANLLARHGLTLSAGRVRI